MFDDLGRAGRAAASFAVCPAVGGGVTVTAALPFGLPLAGAVTSAVGAAAGVAAVTYRTGGDRS